MNIVSTNDFINELLVAGGENPHLGVGSELCAMIAKYEPVYLTAALGYGFYTVLLDNISDSENVPQPYADLLDGVNYTVNNRKYKWEGLRKHTAQFVYYWYQRNTVTVTSVVGQVKPKTENAVSAIVDFKAAKAYNDSVDGACSLKHYLINNKYAYPDFAAAYQDHYVLTKINAFGI